VSAAERDLALLESDRDIKRRLDEELRYKRFKWRSIETVAAAAGLSE
jgi:hypothetical protein